MHYNHPFAERFKLIISDPLNAEIKKSHTTNLNEGVLTLYNGVKVYNQSYYGNFSDILLLNNGIHEPSEEYLFQKVLSRIKNESPLMIELGSYWAFYSMTFLKEFENGKTLCVEVGEEELNMGKFHYALNGLKGEFIQAKVGNGGWGVDEYVQQNNITKIDILHSDIQGYETQMLQGARTTLQNRVVDYMFLSTHSNDLHNECIGILLDCKYNVVAQVDLTNTFCEDGIILAVSPDIQMDNIALPQRTTTSIKNDADLNELLKLI